MSVCVRHGGEIIIFHRIDRVCRIDFFGGHPPQIFGPLFVTTAPSAITSNTAAPRPLRSSSATTALLRGDWRPTRAKEEKRRKGRGKGGTFIINI